MILTKKKKEEKKVAIKTQRQQQYYMALLTSYHFHAINNCVDKIKTQYQHRHDAKLVEKKITNASTRTINTYHLKFQATKVPAAMISTG